MRHRNYLGIYLSEDKATVVCLSAGGNGNVLGCFSVSSQGQEEQKQIDLAALIAQGCAQRNLEFSEVAVALDCAMFMQHQVHSEFKNPKQIASTVRFDAEEALATDIGDVAIAFQIISSGEGGSELTVFTAGRKILSDILASLQSNNIDPVTIEPDVSCLLRFIQHKLLSRQNQQGRTLFGLLSKRRGYFITFSKSQKISTMRTFLVGPAQDRNELLTRQTLITTNLAGASEPISCLKIFDSTDSVDSQQLGQKLGIEAAAIDLVTSAKVNLQALTDCSDGVDFAIAYGAASAHLERAHSLNFRSDSMSYQGKKLRLEKTLKFFSVSVTVLLLALGLYFQTQVLKVNKYRGLLRGKFAPQYLAVMPGSKKLPESFSEAVRKLSSEINRIRDVKSGLISIKGEESVSSKLTMLLEALNKSAAQTDLNIDSISITSKSISISGDTSNPGSTQNLREALIRTKLGSLQDRVSSTPGGRHSFSITIVPEDNKKVQ